MTFRFILQPAMAVIAALRDGVSDARLGRTPYVWAIVRGVRSAEGRSGRLWEGISSTARILILGVVMDTVYQWLVFKTFYPVQAAMIAILLAFVPYLLLRGPDSSASRVIGSRRPAFRLIDPAFEERTMASPRSQVRRTTPSLRRAAPEWRFSARVWPRTAR